MIFFIVKRAILLNRSPFFYTTKLLAMPKAPDVCWRPCTKELKLDKRYKTVRDEGFEP
jgi:hypothetical protein